MNESTPSHPEIPFGRPWIDDRDRQAVMEVLSGHILTHGPRCKEFESRFQALMGGGHAVSTSSCMAALHLGALSLGLGPGDEVLVPAQTHVATVHAVEICGARPVFVDCEMQTGNMDPAAIAALVTPRTRAIFIVHFAGIPAAMDAVMEIARQHSLGVVEDCALALGARFKDRHVGLFGDVGCFSFYPVKHITTGEGGMLVSSQEERARAIALLRAFNVDRSHGQRELPGMYDVTGVGLNYRMSELAAALGASQLSRIDEILARRRRNFLRLKEELAKIEDVALLDARDPDAHSSHYCAVAVLGGKLGGRRNAILRMLASRQVGCSVYYPHPVPRLKYYREKYGYDATRFPAAETISDRSIALPVGPHLAGDDMATIAAELAFSIAHAPKE